MQLKNTISLSLELYALKTRIQIVIFLKNESIFAIIDSSCNICKSPLIAKLNFQYHPTLSHMV